MSNEEVVQARQFQVSDAQGRVRAVLGMSDAQSDADGEKPVFQLKRIDGSVALEMELSPVQTEECASIALYDREGQRRLSIRVSQDSSEYPEIEMTDYRGTRRLRLVITPDDVPEITQFDRQGHVAWEAK